MIGKKNFLLELQLPQVMKFLNVFHLNLLQKVSIDLLNELVRLVIINNKEE